MTWFLEDSASGTAGRARRRVEDLLREAKEIRYVEDGWWIRTIMSTPDEWQHWRRWSQDPKWAEQMERDVPLPGNVK